MNKRVGLMTAAPQPDSYAFVQLHLAFENGTLIVRKNDLTIIREFADDKPSLQKR
jgi:hypothetical protein